MEKVRSKAGKIIKKMTGLFHGPAADEKKPSKSKKARNPLFIGGILACFLLFLVLVVMLTVNNSRQAREKAAKDLAESFKPLPIGPDDLFWPDEPDFVPKVQLDREPREVWTLEEASPHWIDLNRDYGEKWRERIFSVMDNVMEKVP